MSGAGSLFEVLGHLRFTASHEGCPESLQGSVVKLKNATGELFDVPAQVAWVSGKIRKAIIADGVEKEIQLQVGKDTMSKVIEYMKHHAEAPGSQLVTPLPSENLAECGATKWDSNFVKLERDKLFDLMVGATIFDVQGLFFLASAQLSIVFDGKSSEKLRKDLNMSNDLPGDEEERMLDAVNSRRKKKNLPPFEEESSAIATNAAVLAGITASAQKYGVSPMIRKDVGLSTLSGKSWRLAMWTSAVMMDWKVLEDAPRAICEDKELMSIAVALSRGDAFSLAGGDLTLDKPLILEAVQLSGAILKYADVALRSDKAFVREAVMINGGALQGASDSLRSDFDFVLKVTNDCQAGSAVRGASSSLTENADFILSAVIKDPEAFKYASASLTSSKQFAINAAARNGLTLQYMSPQFRADKDVVITAVMENKMASLFAHASRHADIGHLAPSDFSSIDGKKAADVAGTKKLCCSTDEGVVFNGYFFLKAAKMVQYSAQSTMTANMGQANYIAANSYLDKMPFYERPEFDSVTIMWGAVGNIGMRWKAFASADFLNATPDQLLTIKDVCCILSATIVIGQPEWWNCFMCGDFNTREGMIRPTAGFGTGGGYRPGEDASYAISIPPAASDAPLKEDEQTGETQPREMEMEDIPECPLGGWPGLLLPEEALAPRLVKPFQEGARVRLVGVSAKSGMEGVLMRQSTGGKWKVLLDDGSGTALLKSESLEVITFSTDVEAIPEGLSVKELCAVRKEAAAQKAAEDAKVAALKEKERKEAEIQRMMAEAISSVY